MNRKPYYVPPEGRGATEEKEREELLGKGAGRDFEHFTPEFVGTKAQKLDLKKLRGQIARTTKVFEEARIGQQEGKVCFQTRFPVTVFFIGD